MGAYTLDLLANIRLPYIAEDLDGFEATFKIQYAS
jgi:hypothetical protein